MLSTRFHENFISIIYKAKRQQEVSRSWQCGDEHHQVVQRFQSVRGKTKVGNGHKLETGNKAGLRNKSKDILMEHTIQLRNLHHKLRATCRSHLRTILKTFECWKQMLYFYVANTIWGLLSHLPHNTPIATKLPPLIIVLPGVRLRVL
jgi:hypothetical protein